MMARVQVVVAAVIEKEGRFLAARRSAGSLEGFWEFPGGKVEPGENHRAALRREILEELGFVIRVKGLILEVPFDFQGREFRLRAFHSKIESGELHLRDHSQARWFLPQELLHLDLAPADIPVVMRLSEGKAE